MAKLRITNLKQVQTSIRKKITKQLRTEEIRTGVAEIVVKEIRDGDFGRPSDSYRDWREENEGRNDTHKKYNIDKINITFTGELLEDLIDNTRANFKDGKAQFVLEHSDKLHKAYKLKKGKTKRAKYSDISAGVSKVYDYLKFSDKTQGKVIEFIRKKILKNLK